MLVEIDVHIDINTSHLAIVDARAVGGSPGRHKVRLAAEAEGAELKTAPVEIGVKLLRHVDILCRSGGVRLVLEAEAEEGDSGV